MLGSAGPLVVRGIIIRATWGSQVMKVRQCMEEGRGVVHQANTEPQHNVKVTSCVHL